MGAATGAVLILLLGLQTGGTEPPLERVAAALGGAAAFRELDSIRYRLRLRISGPAGAVDAQGEIEIALPDRMRRHLVATPGGELIEILDGDRAWIQPPGTPAPRPASAAERAAMEVRLWRDPAFLLARVDDPRLAVRPAGSETIEGREAELLDIEPPVAGSGYQLVVDAATALPLRRRFADPVAGVEIEELFADWRQTSGIRLPWRVTTLRGGRPSQEVTVEEVALGVEWVPGRLAGVAPEPVTGVRGRILLGPVRPGPVRLGQTSEGPFHAEFVVLDTGGSVVARFHTDQEGRFEVQIPPGVYTIRPAPSAPRLLPLGQFHEVTVDGGAMTEVTLRFDTGIR